MNLCFTLIVLGEGLVQGDTFDLPYLCRVDPFAFQHFHQTTQRFSAPVRKGFFCEVVTKTHKNTLSFGGDESSHQQR